MRGTPFSATVIVCFSFASISAGQDVSVSTPPPASTQEAKAASRSRQEIRPRTQRRRSPGSSRRARPWLWVPRGFASAAISGSREFIAQRTAGVARVPVSRRFRTRT